MPSRGVGVGTCPPVRGGTAAATSQPPLLPTTASPAPCSAAKPSLPWRGSGGRCIPFPRCGPTPNCCFGCRWAAEERDGPEGFAEALPWGVARLHTGPLDGDPPCLLLGASQGECSFAGEKEGLAGATWGNPPTGECPQRSRPLVLAALGWLKFEVAPVSALQSGNSF